MCDNILNIMKSDDKMKIRNILHKEIYIASSYYMNIINSIDKMSTIIDLSTYRFDCQKSAITSILKMNDLESYN